MIFTCFQIILIGFFISENYTNHQYSGLTRFTPAVFILYVWNLFLAFPLFALILPHRQAIQDWARFRFNKNENSPDFVKKSIFSELIFGEKSPAIVAIAINLLITVSGSIVILSQAIINSAEVRNEALIWFGSLLLFLSLMMIYATVAQIMLMLKNSKRILWAAGTTSALIILPILILGVLNIQTENILWLFTISFWFIADRSTFPAFMTAFICQVVILGFLNWYLIKQVQFLGESASKALFSQAKV